MRDALENRITLEQTSEFFDRDETISDPDLRRYVEYMVWEIGGSPTYYRELLDLFASQATEEELVKYISSKRRTK